MIFAKYLPVEGEIVDGTKVMFKINDKWTEPCDFDSFLGPQIQEVKQGKLFICTDEIEIGDKVREGLGEEFEWTRMMDNCLHSNDIYRIIGEVSKDALSFVKEGQAFKSDEIMSSLIEDWKYQVHVKGEDGKWY